MSVKVCPKCGEINTESAMYCINCHVSLNSIEVNQEEKILLTPSASNSTNYYSNEDPVSLGEWVIILIVLAIPVINIIALFVLAFGWDNENISNFGKASLILIGVGLVLTFLLASCQAV